MIKNIKINNISIRVNINHKYYNLLKILIIIANKYNISVSNKLDPKLFKKILK